MDVPEGAVGDFAHTIVKAGISTLPIVGGPAAELFASLVTPPLERRRNEWMLDVSARLASLESKGLDIDRLRDDPFFLDIIIGATRIALATRSSEKRNLLINAVENASMGVTLEELEQSLFLSAIERYSVTHISLVFLFDDPPKWFERAGEQPPAWGSGGLANVIDSAIPELRGQRQLAPTFWKQLVSDGFMKDVEIYAMMSGQGLLLPRTTDLGHRFAGFFRAAY